MTDSIWLRIGDAGEYQNVDDIQGAAELLREYRITGPLVGFSSGVTAPGYTGHNYISIYWGPESAPDMNRKLTHEEVSSLEKML